MLQSYIFQEEFLKLSLARELLIFSIAWMGTHDIILSVLMTAAFVVLADYLFNEKSKLCILPEKFKKIELKSSHSKIPTNLPEEKLYFICLVGTLMATIAHVDDHFDAAEKKALKRCLIDQFALKGKELTLLFDVVEEQACQGFDFYEVAKELNRVASFNDRIHLMECLFEVSIADGEMAHDEAEEIRRITKALRIPHKTFIERKVRALDKIR